MSGSTLFSIGEALIDMIPSRVGCSFDEVPSFSPRTGGAPANVCAAFARLGGKSAFLSQLGDDPFGHKIARELEACGIDLSHLAFTDKASTALAFVSLEEDGSRTFSFYRKPSADLLYSPEQIDPAWFADAFALHYCSVSLVDSPMRYAHLAAIAAAREAGAIVSFDPNLRFPLWPDRDMLRGTVLQFLPLSNILKISDEELEFLTGTADIESALPQVKALVGFGETSLHLPDCTLMLPDNRGIFCGVFEQFANRFSGVFKGGPAHKRWGGTGVPGCSRRKLPTGLHSCFYCAPKNSLAMSALRLASLAYQSAPIFSAYSGVSTAPPTMILQSKPASCRAAMVSSMLLRVVVIRAERPTRCTFFSRTVFTTVSTGTSRPRSITSKP